MKLRYLSIIAFSSLVAATQVLAEVPEESARTVEAAKAPKISKVITQRVGIGTKRPTSPIHLKNRSKSSAGKTTYGEVVDIRDTGAVASGTDLNTALDINIIRSGATGGTIGSTGVDISVVGDAGGESTATGLNVDVSGADVNYAAILRGGNVGIGVAAPDEMLHLDGRLHFEQTEAPTDTTDRLYNVGGTLYWNGISVTSGGGGDIGSDPISLTVNNAAGGSANPLDITSTLASMDGSDSFIGLDINLTNADHTGSGNSVTGIDISGISGDAQATEYALQIGSGWDRAISATGNSVFILGVDDTVLIDAATTDHTSGNAALLIDIDSAAGVGQSIEVENNSTATSGFASVIGSAIFPEQSGTGVGGTHLLIGQYISPVTTSGALAGSQAQYGVYIGNQGAAGTEQAVGLLVESQSGSASNASAVFNGNVGIGDSSPSTLLSVGNNGLFRVESDGDVSVDGDLTLSSGHILDLSATISTANDGLLLPQTTDCSAQTQEGQMCWDTNDSVLYVGNGASVTQVNSSNSLQFTLGANERVSIDGATTVNTGVIGILDIDAKSQTNNFSAVDLLTEDTAVVGTTVYGIRNIFNATGVVAGVLDSNSYGTYNYVTKTGADTNNGIYTLYGTYNFVSSIGATDIGIKNTIAGYFQAFGDNAGSSTAVAISARANGADNNYAALFSLGNVGIADDSPQALLTVGNGEKFTVDGNGNTALGTGANLTVLNGAICVDNDGDCSSLVAGEVRADAFPTTGGDVAEMYNSEETLEPGDVVTIVDNDTIGKSVAPYAATLFGVVSTEPGVILRSGEMYNDATQTRKANTYAVGLVGRVPVKISLENGPIEIGDHLTSSSTPGVAMKATAPGPSIGIALEPFYGSNEKSPKIFCFASLGERNVAALVQGIREENAALRTSLQELREEFEQFRAGLRDSNLSEPHS